MTVCEETREEKRRHVAAVRRGVDGSTSILDFFSFSFKSLNSTSGQTSPRWKAVLES